MGDPTGWQEARGSWRPLLVGLAAFVIVPVLPTALRTVIPVAETMILLTPALAVCALVGWWRGGRLSIALVWVALAIWMLSVSPGTPGSMYGTLARGWVLLLVAAFGAVSLLTPAQPFLVRGLSAVGIALGVAFAVSLVAPGGNGVKSIQSAALSEYNVRTEGVITEFNQFAAKPAWRKMAEQYPSIDSAKAANETELRALPEKGVAIMPALLALESLAALALGWAVYHRFASVPIGPWLGRLRELRFNDQLIWGLAVGGTVFFLPPFEEGKTAGLNLLVFFGTLYVLRGVGVVSWVARSQALATVLIILTAISPGFVGIIALGIGVGDTWMDWRSRIPSGT